MLALALILPAILTHISKAREAEEVKWSTQTMNITFTKKGIITVDFMDERMSHSFAGSNGGEQSYDEERVHRMVDTGFC